MLARLSLRTLIPGLCAVLFLVGSANAAITSTADKFLAQKKALHADVPNFAYMKSNPAAYVDQALELTGKVGGLMKSGDSVSFLLDCGEESFVLRVGKDAPECISNGNTLRVLVKVGPGCTTSMSDLTMLAAAYEYDMCRLEQEGILNASGNRKAKVDKAVAVAPDYSYERAGRRINLSSRTKRIYDPYRRFIAKLNPRLEPDELDTITSSILAYSEHYGMDPRLVVALIIAESGFRPTATSRCGAMGLAQLMPGTASGLGVDNAYDPQQNIQASIRLMRGHLSKFGDLSLALSAYNAGPGAVRKYGGVPPYRETRNYVAKITKIYKALCGK